MNDKLLTAAAGKIGDLVTGRFAPAFAFWFVGLAAWTYKAGWDLELGRIAVWLTDNVGASVILAFACFLTIVVSAVIVDHLALPTLRLLEGYWPRWLARLFDRRRNRHAKRLNALTAEWRRLQGGLETGAISTEGVARIAQLDDAIRRYPSDDNEVLPTRIGNVLRASERRPRDKYGLEPIHCWPHMLLLLPEQARTTLRTSRAELDTAVVSLLWAVLALVWTFWAWWVAPLAVAACSVAYVAFLIPAAKSFADQIEAVFDLYRFELYELLRFPLPTDPATDRQLGELTNQFLLRGLSGEAVAYVDEGDDDGARS